MVGLLETVDGAAVVATDRTGWAGVAKAGDDDGIASEGLDRDADAGVAGGAKGFRKGSVGCDVDTMVAEVTPVGDLRGARVAQAALSRSMMGLNDI
jgi:hypothetical protein